MDFHDLAHDGLECRVGCGHCDVRPQLDPRQVRGGGTVGNSPHETSWQINIADAGNLINLVQFSERTFSVRRLSPLIDEK